MSTYPDFTRILNQKLSEQERSATWLAKRLDLHPGTVNRWLNQELRPATPELVARVADLLCIHKAAERQALMVAAGYAYVEGEKKPTSAPQLTPELPPFMSEQPRHNLPTSPTAFVGREAELTQLAAQLAQPDVRLLTLVGFGGIGKTRLAVAMAARLIDDFADGVWFVPLVGVDASASQNALNPLVMSLANVLSVVFLGQEEPEDQLLNYLHDKEMLIIFDNVEHLLSLSDFFSRLLSKCPSTAWRK